MRNYHLVQGHCGTVCTPHCCYPAATARNLFNPVKQMNHMQHNLTLCPHNATWSCSCAQDVVAAASYVLQDTVDATHQVQLATCQD